MIKKYLDKLELNVILEKISDYTYTKIGKDITLNLKPKTNADEVRNLLDETQEAVDLIHKCGSMPIYEFNDMSLQIKKIESSISLSSRFLLDFANVLKNARELMDYYKESNITFTHLSNYFDNLYSNKEIENEIFKCIISEDEISDNASKKLSAIRKNKKNMELQIKSRLNSIIHSNTYSKYLSESIVTIRNDRYVIPVKEEYRTQVKGFVHDISSSGSTVYIEPMEIFELNNSINNLTIEENREIDRILESLSEKLFPISSFIKNDIYLIGKLDFISAKAKYAIENDCVNPKIESYVDLKNVRHPLIEKDKVVPINIYVGKTDFNTLVITGPNTGGKTVTLKTVGLTSAMAQCGLHIFANENSCIKVFDNIFADIGDEQSIEESLSTFSAHITNIVNILKEYTSDSLILLDELGSGTDPIEGANLAISLLEEFNHSNCITIATTHYHEIKEYCLTHSGFENCSLEFDIKNLKPTYHLLIGIPGKSNAFAICKKIGIPDFIIERAKSLISKPDVDIESLMKQAYDNKIEIEKKKEEAQKNLNQIELIRKELQRDYSDKIEKEKQKVEEAKKEARDILLNAKDEADEIISKLNKIKSNETNKANNLRNKLNDSIKETGYNGIDLSVLLKLNDKTTRKTDENINGKSNKKGQVYIKNTHAKNAKTEINLIGETVGEAIPELEQFLDNAKMAHIYEVRVVHGKGTGKLREGIHKYLKTSKYDEDFRIGGYGEGDYGVTIVHLKQ